MKAARFLSALLLLTACAKDPHNEVRVPSSTTEETPYTAVRTFKDENGQQQSEKAPWALVNGSHWRMKAQGPTLTSAATDARENNRGLCKPGMVEVKGRMRLDPKPVSQKNWHMTKTVEELQKSTCTGWINKTYPERCKRFDQDKWQRIVVDIPQSEEKHFCIDRYEFPNMEGEYPMIMVTYPEARNLCETQGKRLCDEDEWTLACEGEDAQPYPYGFERSEEKCNIDRPWTLYNAKFLLPRNTQRAVNELYKLWKGAKSGEYKECRSPFGVYDMTGNIDEWTTSTRRNAQGQFWEKNVSILKGGYWGPVRNRCRPSTRSHDTSHTFYQQGVRCCANPSDN